MNPLPSHPQGEGNLPAGASGSTAGAGNLPTFSPLYQQIKALLTQSLQSGEWKPGELIPSEVELAARFKVSQGTVRKAIDELAAENLVMRRQGKGTFVSTHHEERAHFRFLRLMPDAGVPHHPDNRILDVARRSAPAEVAQLLGVAEGTPLLSAERVSFTYGDKPVELRRGLYLTAHHHYQNDLS